MSLLKQTEQAEASKRSSNKMSQNNMKECVTWAQQESQEECPGGLDDAAQVGPEEQQGDGDREQELQDNIVRRNFTGNNPHIAGCKTHQDAHQRATQRAPNLGPFWP